MAVYGGSYGGYMVLASAVHYGDRLKAAVMIEFQILLPQKIQKIIAGPEELNME